MAQNILINFNDVKEQSAVPAGIYSIRVNEVMMKENSDKSGYYLNWDLIITTPGEHIDRHVYLMTSLKPNVLWRLKNVIKAIGVDPGEINFEIDEETGVVLEPDFRNYVAVAKITNEVYQGVTRDRVEDLYPMTDVNDVVSGPAYTGGVNRPAATPGNRPVTSTPRRVLK